MMMPLSSNAFHSEEHAPFLWESGPAAALFIHGFPGTPAEMRPMAEALHRAGWTTQGVLLPGFGRDIETLPTRRHEEWLAAVDDALTALQRQHGPVILVGHSMGGALAICAAARAAQRGQPVSGLALFAPFWQIDHVIWSLLPVIKIFVPHFSPFRVAKPDFSNPEFRKGIGTFFPDADLDDPQTQKQILGLKLPIAMFNELRVVGRLAHQLAPQVAAPALVMQGLADDLVRPLMTRQLMRRLRGALHYVEVEADHNLIRPSSPAWRRVEHVLTDFARQLEPKTSIQEN